MLIGYLRTQAQRIGPRRFSCESMLFLFGIAPRLLAGSHTLRDASSQK